MKVLVFAHQLELGGTQTNAIDLAAALRDLCGFDVLLFATPGPAASIAAAKGLRYVPAPDAYVHPSPARIRALRELCRREHPDVIHAWDWWQGLDAYYTEHLVFGTPLVISDMYMTMTRILPKTVLTTFGTPELVDLARAAGRHRAELLLPPVDTEQNAPGAVDSSPFIQQWQVRPEEISLVTVSRLSSHMKGESLERSIKAVGTLGRSLPLRLFLVGDGDGRAGLQSLADEVNRDLGRPAVVLTGAMLDPRPAYAAATVVIGMGGSALRGMAFGKPVIVVGEGGFSAPLSEETLNDFLYKGIFGVAAASPGNAKHEDDIRALATAPEALARLGTLARRFVVQHFALQEGAQRLADFLRQAREEARTPLRSAVDGARSAYVLVRERRLISYRFWNRIRQLSVLGAPR